MRPKTKNKKILSAPVRYLRKIHGSITPFTHTAARLLTSRRLYIAGGAAVLLLSIVYAAAFYWPRAITFSYSGKTCFANPTLLPRMIDKKKAVSYDAAPADVVSVAGYPVYAGSTCITAAQLPKDKAVENITLAARGNPAFRKHIRITAGTPPTLANQDQLSKPVATKDPLVLTLDRPDSIFGYRLSVDGREIPCTKQTRTVRCPVEKLNLAQSAHYTFALQRVFKDRAVKTVFQQSMATVEAVQITAASIAAGQMIYDIPTAMTLQLNKSAESLKGASLYALAGDQRQELPATITLEDKTVTVRFDKPLPRNAALAL